MTDIGTGSTYLTTSNVICPSPAITTGSWYLVTVTASATGYSLYVNGKLAGTTAYSGTPQLWSPSAPIQIGGYTNGPSYLNGRLDDIRAYDRVLNTTEINELYVNQVAPAMISYSSITTYDNWGNVIYTSGPLGQQAYYSYANTDSQNSFVTSLAGGVVGYWSLDEGKGTTTADVSGNGNVGTLLNSPSWQTGSSCKFGDCLSFTGSSSRSVSIPSSNSITISSSTSSFTLSFWFRIASTPTSAEALVSKSGVCSSCSDTGYGVELTSSGHLTAYLMSAGTILGSAAGSGSISTGVWHNVVLIDNAGSLTLYLDHSSYATGTATAGSISSTNPLTFGSDGSGGLYFTGSIDEVKLYDRAISTTEVTGLYSGSSTFSNTFYSNETVSSDIHDALIGQAQMQNGAGTPAQETYFKYNIFAELLTQKQSHSSGWIYTTYTYDHYGNRITMTNALGVTTHYHYSSTYSEAYLTLVSTDVTTSSPGTLALDGSAQCSSSTGAATCTLSTSSSPDVIMMLVSFQATSGTIACTTSTASGGGLTWSNRGGGSWSGSKAMCEYYAIASSTLSSASLTWTPTTGTSTSGTVVTVFGVSGANTGSPFDSNGALPCFGAGSSTSPTCSISTSNAKDMLISGLAAGQGGTYTAPSSPSSWTKIGTDTTGGTTVIGDGAFLVVSSTQSGLSAQWSLSSSHTWEVMGDAIVAASTTTQNVTQSYTYSSSTGYMLSETDGNGHTTSYSYDSLGRVVQTSSPTVGGVSATTYIVPNDPGDYVTVTDPNGNVVKDYYDGLARLTSVQTYNGSSLYSTQSYSYNWDNLVATETLPSSSAYTYTYNQDGQQVKMVNPDSTTVTTSYNPVANTKMVWDENGHPTVYAYNWDGQLLSVEQYYSSTSYYTTSYTYDLSGNLLTTTVNGATTTYQYNDLNELIKTTYPDSSYQTQSYNKVGDMTGEVNPGGTLMNYTYDALNRLTQVSYPGGATLTYTYDGDGNVLSMVNSAATTYYTYNARDMVTNETEYISGTKYSVLYGYDKVGNVKSMVYPDGYNITITYDALNRIHKLGSFATIYYNTDNDLTEIKYANGEIGTYSYNSRDQPTQIAVTNGGVKRLDLNYTYDGDGNVKTINTESYGYNWLNELTSTSGPWGSISYTYDGAGNMLTQVKGSTTTTYSYGSYNRLSSAGKVNFTYDGNGNVHTIANGSSSWTYDYNYGNQLTTVQLGGATVATYSYDGGGQLAKSIETSTQVFAYQGSNRIFAKNTGTSSISKYFYADGLLVASINGTSTDYYHEDALGSVRLESSSSVTTLFTSDYKPYGPTWAITGSIAFEYAGMPKDSVTGLYISGGKVYDPAIGRYMTEATAPVAAENPLALNRYIYADDNPELVSPTISPRFVNPVSEESAKASGTPIWSPGVAPQAGGGVAEEESQGVGNSAQAGACGCAVASQPAQPTQPTLATSPVSAAATPPVTEPSQVSAPATTTQPSSSPTTSQGASASTGSGQANEALPPRPSYGGGGCGSAGNCGGNATPEQQAYAFFFLASAEAAGVGAAVAFAADAVLAAASVWYFLFLTLGVGVVIGAVSATGLIDASIFFLPVFLAFAAGAVGGYLIKAGSAANPGGAQGAWEAAMLAISGTTAFDVLMPP